MADSSAGWERLASRTGGTVGAVATATAADSATVVFAATSVGVHSSSDGGRSWTLSGVENTVPFAEALAPSPSFARDRMVFVGAGDGLYRSLDGGDRWHRVLVGSRVLSLAISPGDGSAGLLLAGTETDGVLRSDDSGRTWAGANAGLVDLTVLALALSPRFEQDRTGFAGTASGLYRTRNGGRSWRVVETGLNEPAVQSLAVSPSFADDRLVLAGTEGDGLLRSDDAGTTWEVVPAMAGRSVTALAFSTGYPARRTIAAATDQGVTVSLDGGQTWRAGDRGPGPVLGLTFVRSGDGEALLAGLARSGVARSDDEGATWTLANEGLSARVVLGLVPSPAFARDQTLFIAGLRDGVSVSTDGGRTWAERNDGLEDAAVFGLAVSPGYASDRTLYAATPAGVFFSRDGGATWHQSPAASAPALAVTTGPPSRHAPRTLLAAQPGGRLVASGDGGQTWRTLREAFDGAEVVSIVLSPGYARDRTIFVGTSRPTPDGDGELVLWRSTDGGERWQRWLVERGADVLPVAVPPTYHMDELVFAGLGGRILKPLRHTREVRSGERRPIWRGADLPNGAARVTALVASPTYGDDRTLFAATSAGVFVSRDGGETFGPWSEALIPSSVVALAVSPSYLEDRLIYAISLGGSVWRRRDK